MNQSTTAQYTDIGGRQVNEDAVAVLTPPLGILAVVADGLGGHGGGDIASHLCVDAIRERLKDMKAATEPLVETLLAANLKILETQRKTDGQMRTSVTVLWFYEGQALAAHVGDSRIYQFRDGQVLFQSVDHSLSQIAVMTGEITLDQIRGHVDRNKLIRAMGSTEDMKIDLTVLEARAGDAFLLCSDGFWELIVEQEMIDCLKQSSDAKEWLDRMRGIVSSRLTARSDNNTAAVIML